MSRRVLQASRVLLTLSNCVKEVYREFRDRVVSSFRGSGASRPEGALLIISCCMYVLIGTSSCNVHQWPDESTPAALKLDFVFATDLPPYLTVDYEGTKTAAEAAAAASGNSFRYTVKFYPSLPDGTFSRAASEDYTLVLTKDDLTTLDYSAVTYLPEGTWQVRCWADYVERGSTGDLFYNTADFSAIELAESYTAGTDRKDAFLGVAEVTLRRVGTHQAPVTARLEMERPLAKFQFIATDFGALVTKVMREKSSFDPSKAPGFTPSDYYIRFYYTSFLPSVFNLFTNKPIDSRSGVQFDSEFTPLSMDEVLMGFDYVLVNGHESSVSVQVALYDKSTNNLLSLSPPITVPLTRSKLTTVRGDFLTLSTGGGIGVCPDFDGEYNITIP